MNAITTETDLKTLENRLQMLLQERDIPLGVRCGVQGDRLIIVGHHQPDVMLEPMQVLRSLQILVRSFGLAFTRRVRLYLRVMGRQWPYARCHFLLEEKPGWLVQTEDAQPIQLVAWLEDCGPEPPPGDEFDARYRGALMCPEIYPVDWVAPEGRQVWRWVGRLENNLALTAVVGLALSGYMVSSPCVGSTCPEYQTAQEMGQASQHLMEQAQDAEDLKQAQDYLSGAVGLLDTIPRWSERSPEALDLIEGYRQQQVWMTQAIAAAEVAEAAQEKHDQFNNQMESWGAIQLLWQQAIDGLQAIPPDSPLHAFAQNHLERYRTQLAFAREHHTLEEQGQEQLFMAKQEIRQAQVKHAKAITTTDWQLTWVAWETAINRLREIAPDTEAGIEAQRLLTAYGQIPAELGDRLQVGILETPEPPPERTYQTPVNWSDLEQDIQIPPPPIVLETGSALP